MTEPDDEDGALKYFSSAINNEEEEEKKEIGEAEDSSGILNEIDSFCEEPSVINDDNKDKAATEEERDLTEEDLLDIQEKTPVENGETKVRDKVGNEEASDSEELNFDLLDEKEDGEEDLEDSTDIYSLEKLENFSMDQLMEMIKEHRDFKFDPKEVIRRIEYINKFYPKVLEEVYKMYKTFPNDEAWKIPPKVRPRNFWTDDRIGFETLEEYVDNHHPLWLKDRQFCHDFLAYGPEVSGSLADYVNLKWGMQHIDVSENLSVINEVTQPSQNQKARRPSFLGRIEHLNNHSDCQARVLSDFCKVDFDAVKQKVLEKERKRLKTYRAYSEGSNSNNNVENLSAKVPERQFTEEEVKRILMSQGEKEGRGVKRTADAVFGVEEVFNMKRHYQKTEEEATIPRSHVDEILCMEAACDKFNEVYNDEDSDQEEDVPLRPDEY